MAPTKEQVTCERVSQVIQPSSDMSSFAYFFRSFLSNDDEIKSVLVQFELTSGQLKLAGQLSKLTLACWQINEGAQSETPDGTSTLEFLWR